MTLVAPGGMRAADRLVIHVGGEPSGALDPALTGKSYFNGTQQETVLYRPSPEAVTLSFWAEAYDGNAMLASSEANAQRADVPPGSGTVRLTLQLVSSGDTDAAHDLPQDLARAI